MVKEIVGVLALQGGFSRHIAAIRQCGAEAIEVRQVEDLQRCSRLILPGGESTVMAKLMAESSLDDAIREFSKTHPVFGTCAGAILMAKEAHPAPFSPLGLVDIHVERNFYGRQIASFFHEVTADIPSSANKISGYFIRAPRITFCGPETTILGHMEGDPVLVQQGRLLVATFHPELTDSIALHQFFLTL